MSIKKRTSGVVRLWTVLKRLVITTDPNPLTYCIHNTKHGMPAILSAGDEDSWLDPGLGKKDIAGLLRDFLVGGMGACVIESDF